MSFASAAALLVWASAKNRARRLVKQPRYLVFLLVGAGYLFSVGSLRGPASAAPTPFSEVSPVTILGVGLLVFLYVAAAWLFGADRAALSFTEAEVQFFFPAPVRRRSLVHYKLLRMLLSALLAGPLLAVIMRKTTVYGAIGFFFAFASLSLHRMCASMTRASLLEHGLSRARRRFVTLALVLALLAGIAWSFSRTVSELPSLDGGNAARWLGALQVWATEHERVLGWALYPVIAVMRVMHATSPEELLAGLPGALGVLAVHYVWAVGTSVAFEESAAEAAEKRARSAAVVRGGAVRRGGPLFHLDSTGAPWVAIFWKSLMAGTRVTRVELVRYAVLLAIVPISVGVTMRGHGNTLALVAAVTLIVAAVVAVVGPHVVGNDLRGDIEHIDILRSYPLTGRQTLLGELLAPLAMLAAVEWALVSLGVGLGFADGVETGSDLALIGGALAVALPVLTAGALVLRNLLVLVLPSWAAPAGQETRGLELSGQRTIVMIGTLAVLALFLAPAGAAGYGAWLLLQRWMPMLYTLPVVAAVGAVVAVVELDFALGVLGRAFDTFDVSRR